MIAGFIISFILGVYIGAFTIIALQQGNRPIRTSSTILTEDRKTDLVERMCDIFEENRLNVDEIASIIRTAGIENERTLKAANQIADLVLVEKLSIAESTDLFNVCYDALFFV